MLFNKIEMINDVCEKRSRYTSNTDSLGVKELVTEIKIKNFERS